MQGLPHARARSTPNLKTVRDELPPVSVTEPNISEPEVCRKFRVCHESRKYLSPRAQSIGVVFRVSNRAQSVQLSLVAARHCQ
jgi:hypothetical protein